MSRLSVVTFVCMVCHFAVYHFLFKVPLFCLFSIDATDVTTTPMDLDESRDATRGGQNAPTARSNPVSRDDASRERVPFTYLSVLKDRINSQVPQIGAVRGRVKVHF